MIVEVERIITAYGRRDRDITGLPPYDVARLGIGYVPDDRRIFPDLTVAENLEIGRRAAGRPGRWTAAEVTALFPVLGDGRVRGISRPARARR